MNTKEKVKNIFKTMQAQFGYKNIMQAPKVSKLVVSVGVGSISDKAKRELIVDRLRKITGQTPADRGAKQSIAAFKTREGDIVGHQVTLRGQRMYDFLDKLINVALPRTKDFQGLRESAVDNMGNFTIGIPEHTIFPESSDEELKDVFGMAVTVVTTAKSKEEALVFLKELGLPIADDSKE